MAPEALWLMLGCLEIQSEYACYLAHAYAINPQLLALNDYASPMCFALAVTDSIRYPVASMTPVAVAVQYITCVPYAAKSPNSTHIRSTQKIK